MTATHLLHTEATLTQEQSLSPPPAIDGQMSPGMSQPTVQSQTISIKNLGSEATTVVTDKNDLITEIVQQFLEGNSPNWLENATKNLESEKLAQILSQNYAQNLYDFGVDFSVKNKNFGKNDRIVDQMVDAALLNYNTFAHTLQQKKSVTAKPAAYISELKQIAAIEMSQIVQRTSDNFYRQIHKKPQKIQKLAKKNLMNFFTDCPSKMHSGFSRESLNCVFEPDNPNNDPVVDLENDCQDSEPAVLPQIECEAAPVEEQIESHFDFLPEPQLSKTEPVPPRKSPEIAEVFNVQLGFSETWNSKPKYRPQKLPPMEIVSDKKLAESLKKHANFDLSGKIAKPLPGTDNLNLHVTSIKEKHQQNEFEMVKQATEFVLKLHKEKRERLQKTLTRTLPKIEDPSACIQQIKVHQVELEEKKRQRIRQSIDRINKRNHERKVLNMMSDQLVRILQMENQQKLGYPAKNNSYLPTTLQNGMELTDAQKFYFTPLEVVVPPKNGTRKLSQTKTKVELDHEAELREINKTLVSKINDMQSKLTFLQKKTAEDRNRLKHIRPDSSLQPGIENVAPARPISKPSAAMSPTYEKIFGQTNVSGGFITTYRSSYFKENSTAEKARAQRNTLARNLNESNCGATRNLSQGPAAATERERESHLESLRLGASQQTRLLSSLLPRQTESVINPWRQSVLH